MFAIDYICKIPNEAVHSRLRPLVMKDDCICCPYCDANVTYHLNRTLTFGNCLNNDCSSFFSIIKEYQMPTFDRVQFSLAHLNLFVDISFGQNKLKITDIITDQIIIETIVPDDFNFNISDEKIKLWITFK